MNRKVFLAAISAAALLGACTYSQIDPAAALEDIRANNGYYDLQEIEPSASKLVVRAAGTGYPAHFSISTSSQPCRDFSALGHVAYAGRGVVYPWIARMAQRGSPYLAQDVQPGQPIQVRGHGYWADGSGVSYRSGQCGPVVAQFTPQAGRGYTVEFVWGSKPACQLVVMDATDPDAPVPVAADNIRGCAAPSYR